jgi:hypothetical protein
MKTKLIVLAVVTTGLLGQLASSAQAKRFNSGNQVVHTRLAPVVVHKAFPPYGLGVHVYAGRNNSPPATQGR